MVNEKTIPFQGTLTVEGDLSTLDMDELKDYLRRAVGLYLDTEEEGVLSEDLEVTGIGIDWESLS